MITVVLIILAAICKAVADTLDDHFSTSIFKHLPASVWDANVSTVKPIRIFGLTNYKPDPWHFANSGMIICFALAIALNDLHLAWWLSLLILGTVFNLVFELLYSKLFRSWS